MRSSSNPNLPIMSRWKINDPLPSIGPPPPHSRPYPLAEPFAPHTRVLATRRNFPTFPLHHFLLFSCWGETTSLRRGSKTSGRSLPSNPPSSHPATERPDSLEGLRGCPDDRGHAAIHLRNFAAECGWRLRKEREGRESQALSISHSSLHNAREVQTLKRSREFILHTSFIQLFFFFF